jgi:hypothetical protein
MNLRAEFVALAPALEHFVEQLRQHERVVDGRR